MDADRMDYLLRDSYYAGVQYGHYDLNRVVSCLRLCPDPETEGHYIGVDEDGIHAVEGLLIARFMMFTQLYFHKTRSIYDYHLTECLKELLRDVGGHFPLPTNISDYLAWDDWRVLGAIADSRGGEHGDILRNRTHYRRVFSTAEVADSSEFERAVLIQRELSELGCVARDAEKSWYKSGPDEIKVLRSSDGGERSVPLATMSSIVRGLVKVNQRRLYVPLAHKEAAEQIVKQWYGETAK
jgi:HD superfamily phosphohydrolase